MNQARVKVFERYLANSGYIGYCLGVAGGIFVHSDPEKCAELCAEVFNAIEQERVN